MRARWATTRAWELLSAAARYIALLGLVAMLAGYVRVKHEAWNRSGTGPPNRQLQERAGGVMPAGLFSCRRQTDDRVRYSRRRETSLWNQHLISPVRSHMEMENER